MRCDICGKLMNQQNTRMGEPLYYCHGCGLRKIEAVSSVMMEDDFDYRHALEKINHTRAHNFSIIARRIKEFFGNRYAEVCGLEVGTGIGLFMDVASNNGLKLHGIEPIEDNYMATKMNGEKTVIHGFFPMDLDEKAIYDFIVFNDVYEHLADTDNMMQSVTKHLKTGGLLVINIPVSTGIIYRVSRTLDFLHFHIGGVLLRRLYQLDTSSPHMYYFNGKSLNRLAVKYGMSRVFAPLRMKTYSIMELSERIKLIDMRVGPIVKRLAVIIGIILYPVIRLMPADTICYFYKKNGCYHANEQE